MSPTLIGIVALIAYKYYRYRQSAKAGDQGSSPARWISNPTLMSVMLNAFTIVSGFYHLMTWDPMARFWSIAASIANSIYILVMNYGTPKLSREAIMEPIREWVGKAMSGTEFSSLFFSFI
jgi:hypothetical protein